MITGITIQNFKGIGERVKLDLCPITLLFGANSSGKSTILHALHYAREIFERRNLDADQTIGGGKFIDLGGFRNMVHNHDAKAKITIGIGYSHATGSPLPTFDPGLYLSYYECDQPMIEGQPVSAESVDIELDIASGPTGDYPDEAPIVTRYTVTIDGRQISSITAAGDFGFRHTLSIDLLHPSLAAFDGRSELIRLHANLLRSNVPIMDRVPKTQWTNLFVVVFNLIGSGMLADRLEDRDDGGLWLSLDINTESGALPFWDNAIRIQRDYSGIDSVPTRPRPARKPKGPPESWNGSAEEWRTLEDAVSQDNAIHDSYFEAWLRILDEVISQIICGTGQECRDRLNDFRYIGPLREFPDRDFAQRRQEEPGRWASGLGAWDTLFRLSPPVLGEISDWLERKDRLNAGCRLEKRYWYELTAVDREKGNLDETKMRPSVVIVPVGSGHPNPPSLQPRDVGVGVSQLLPVVVAAVCGKPDQLVAIEQPELHVHPRLQTALGDLFIESLGQPGSCFLLETHSEHLILRLLRRIRETTQGKAPEGRELRTSEIAVYYVSQGEESTNVQRIDVDADGEFIQPWPDDFFEIDFYERFG